MKKLLGLLSEEVTKAFVECGYDEKYGKVTLSNRSDLCEYQCNGAMAAAKEYKCAPFMISDKVAEILSKNPMFSMAESVKPGFLNLKLSNTGPIGMLLWIFLVLTQPKNSFVNIYDGTEQPLPHGRADL